MTSTLPTAPRNAEDDGAASSLREVFDGYSDEERPLAAYATLTGIYNASFAALLLVSRSRTGTVAPPVGMADIAMMGVATHKLARLITKDFVTSFLRAPFTRYEGHGTAHAEVEESARGTGMRRALGELLTCPYCVAQWVAPALWFGSLLAPAPTRLATRVFTTVAVADVLHLAYIRATKDAAK